MRILTPFVLLFLLASLPLFAKDARLSLPQIEELLEAGQADTALDSLDRRIKKNSGDSEALFLRSTAHIMVGDLAAGRLDLSACLEIDPLRRQAWLNLAALDLAEEDYAGAVDAFTRAEALDPEASGTLTGIRPGEEET